MRKHHQENKTYPFLRLVNGDRNTSGSNCSNNSTNSVSLIDLVFVRFTDGTCGTWIGGLFDTPFPCEFSNGLTACGNWRTGITPSCSSGTNGNSSLSLSSLVEPFSSFTGGFSAAAYAPKSNLVSDKWKDTHSTLTGRIKDLWKRFSQHGFMLLRNSFINWRKRCDHPFFHHILKGVYNRRS